MLGRYGFFALMLIGVGCAGDPEPEPENVPEAGTEAVMPADAGLAAGADAVTLTAGDFDVYERGLRKEIDLVRQVQAEYASAGPAEQAGVLLRALPEETMPTAAREAGVSLDHYRSVAGILDEALGARAMSTMMTGMMAGMDTTDLSPDVREQVREQMRTNTEALAQTQETTYERIPASLRELFNERAARLDSLKSYLAGLRLSLGR